MNIEDQFLWQFKQEVKTARSIQRACRSITATSRTRLTSGRFCFRTHGCSRLFALLLFSPPAIFGPSLSFLQFLTCLPSWPVSPCFPFCRLAGGTLFGACTVEGIGFRSLYWFGRLDSAILPTTQLLVFILSFYFFTLVISLILFIPALWLVTFSYCF